MFARRDVPFKDYFMRQHLSRRAFLSSVSAGSISALFSRLSRADEGTPPRKRSLLGLTGTTYYLGFNPFLNWWKTATPISLKLSNGQRLSGTAAWESGKYLNPSSGEIVTPAPAGLESISRLFFSSTPSPQGVDFSGETWIIEWDGVSDTKVDFLTAGGKLFKLTPNKLLMKMGEKPGNTQLTFMITDPMRPPHNIRVYQERYAKNMERRERFNPDWIAQIKQFSVLRFMDWMSTNGSAIRDFSELADESYSSWGQRLDPDIRKREHGPKAAVHPSLICEIANLTGCNVHVCIPVGATDDFVTDFSKYFRDHTSVEVTYELSNECWNWGFPQASYCNQQGLLVWPNEKWPFVKWYGFRSAQCMNIIRDVYRNSNRWRGAISTQTVNPSVTQAAIDGISHFLSNERSGSVRISDLFKSLYVTGYFGDVVGSKPISNITRSNPAIVTSNRHGYAKGQRLRLFLDRSMQGLNNATVTAMPIDENSYSIDRDTTGFDAFAPLYNSYAVPSLLFDLMDESAKKCSEDPRTYSNNYQFFNQMIAESCLTGNSSAGFNTRLSVDALKNEFWPKQLLLARENGLTLRQYEGGCHFVGDAYLQAYGGNPTFTDYLLHFGHSHDVAMVYTAMFAAFHEIGGEFPSKFVEAGLTSRYGTWAGIRFWPTTANGNRMDTDNPVWKSVLTM